ncbi:2-oxoacid:acceptor oxidoreductase subunit alpha [Synergistaceae bacterium OttesenSCG-928-I11]|nr:2-oxoacid:acceptor oxidoreductase subunit alpha [Synergistaceae bacterium OttesenSCG-928-I11]
MSEAKRTETVITFSAAAGLGLQTAEDLAGKILSGAGFYVFSTREYMSRVRGGNNSSQFRVSTSPVRAQVDRIDWLFALSPGLHVNVTENISKSTRIVGDTTALAAEIAALGFEMVDIDLIERAKKIGGAVYASMIVAGFITGIFGFSETSADDYIAVRFGSKPEVVEKNGIAFREGHRLGLETVGGEPVLQKNTASKKSFVFMDGDTALGLAAAAAGCNYITAYPMSPGTGVFSFFARNADALDAVVEQAEDEISAINMALGASYAGARAMTTTSGGGFVLMTEGISLAGITETPVVIHLAQRPGPATGLATRTEQADLEIALHAGHGEFPRAIFAPINVESTFTVAGRAFETAWKYQTPSVILTDQYLLDTGYDVKRPVPASIRPPVVPAEAPEGYARYRFPEDGKWISPFAVPGHGPGFVSFDSHEHTEDAHITENREIRRKMVEKRLAKEHAMREEAMPHILIGPEDHHTLLVCWGSTFEPLREALAILSPDGVALAACEQLNPLPESFVRLMAKESAKIFVEGNATAQFARLVRAQTGATATDTILKYDGYPFTVDELVERVGRILEKFAKGAK